MIRKSYNVGTIREWNGVKYKKIAPGKWRPVGSEKHSRKIQRKNDFGEVDHKKVVELIESKKIFELLDSVYKDNGLYATLSSTEKAALNYYKKQVYDGLTHLEAIEKYKKDHISVEVSNFEATVKQDGEEIGNFKISLKDQKKNIKRVDNIVNGAKQGKKGSSAKVKTPPKSSNQKQGIAQKLRNEFTESTNQYLGKEFENKSTGIKAVFSKESQKELKSRTQNTKDNGFTIQQHFEVVNNIIELFENATLEKVHNDVKHGDKNVEIERFLSKEITLQSGQKVQACITIKHTLDTNGRLIYSLEAMDIKNALEKTRAKGQDPKGDLSNTDNIEHGAGDVNENLSNKIEKNPAKAIERAVQTAEKFAGEALGFSSNKTKQLSQIFDYGRQASNEDYNSGKRKEKIKAYLKKYNITMKDYKDFSRKCNKIYLALLNTDDEGMKRENLEKLIKDIATRNLINNNVKKSFSSLIKKKLEKSFKIEKSFSAHIADILQGEYA